MSPEKNVSWYLVLCLATRGSLLCCQRLGEQPLPGLGICWEPSILQPSQEQASTSLPAGSCPVEADGLTCKGSFLQARERAKLTLSEVSLPSSAPTPLNLR